MCSMHLAPVVTMTREEAHFRAFFPRALLQRIARAVLDTGKSAYARAREFEDSLFLDADIALRRLLMEQALRTLVLPPGFKFETPRTPSGSYAKIWSPRVVLTACTRDEDVASVEPYRYRETLAKGAQFNLFEKAGEFDPSASLFALLVYGGPHGRRAPTLAKVSFPDPEGRIISSINLIREFPNIFASDETDGMNEEAEPKLRELDQEDDQGDT